MNIRWLPGLLPNDVTSLNPVAAAAGPAPVSPVATVTSNTKAAPIHLDGLNMDQTMTVNVDERIGEITCVVDRIPVDERSEAGELLRDADRGTQVRTVGVLADHTGQEPGVDADRRQ
ncbi:hypothetical protein GCM10010112_19870 [Actinoplanes lobatus]|uniref:Uncharacterized protein n=1 Tax=Actinoplanes lobatus TaxID=113568 RepID=A0ABQ4AWA4_9ACTN|nr:hypothetical protein GCM10010112_19870 [Actinoplanes lobatus]GIE44879.1 hypothetical protein Alo02nite_77770 [Actinoplanes lobatus]